MNFTKPGRMHLIWNKEVFYLTIYVAGIRFHYCNKTLGEGTNL